MKKVLSITVIFLLGIGLNAQPVANKFIVGGSMSFYFEKNDQGENDISKRTSISFTPKAGYFISEKIATGLQISITNTKSNESLRYQYSTIDVEASQFVFNAVPYMRYYVISGNAGLFIQGAVSIGMGKRKTEYSEDFYTDDESDIFQFSAGISPGVYYFINPRIALEASVGGLGYNYESEGSGDEKRKYSKFGFDLKTTGLSFGLMFIL